MTTQQQTATDAGEAITAAITQERADEIILASEYAEDVEDGEENELGYIYTTWDGRAITVTFDGRLVVEAE